MLFKTPFARHFRLISGLGFSQVRAFAMHVLTIPAFSDNYMYLLVDEKTNVSIITYIYFIISMPIVY